MNGLRFRVESVRERMLTERRDGTLVDRERTVEVAFTPYEVEGGMFTFYLEWPAWAGPVPEPGSWWKLTPEVKDDDESGWTGVHATIAGALEPIIQDYLDADRYTEAVVEALSRGYVVEPRAE